jgi:hypothetical protein
MAVVQIDGVGVQNVRATDHAHVTVGSAATVGFGVFAHGASTIDLNSGVTIFGPVQIEGDSSSGQTAKVILNGAQVTNNASVGENATFQMTSGDISRLLLDENGVADIQGGNVFNDVNSLGHSFTSLGGVVVGAAGGGAVGAEGNAVVFLNGTTVLGDLYGYGNSVITMSSGHVTGTAYGFGNSKVILLGGQVDFGVSPPGPASGSGLRSFSALCEGDGCDPLNPFPHGFVGYENSEFDFVGFSLQSVLVDPNYRPFDDGISYSVHQLSGRMANGMLIDGGLVYIQNETGARFQLLEAPVPEPSSIVLMISVAILGGLLRPRR